LLKEEKSVRIEIIYDEVEDCLDLLNKTLESTARLSDWNRLFQTRGFKLLKKRELEMENSFSDSEFQAYLQSQANKSFVHSYMNSLQHFKDIDLLDIQKKVMKYLPKKAFFNTTIIPVIKPKKNSFVHRIEGESYLFTSLEPDCLKAKLENKLIHELHHIGLDSVYDPKKYQTLDKNTQKMIEWTNAFGEGFAMLAAVGGPQYHPVPFDETAKEVWDENIKNFEVDFNQIQRFLFSILEGQFEDDKALKAKGMELMMNNGGQGSWYTVGWKLSVIIEAVLGRKALIDCMEDLRNVYLNYNKAVEIYNNKHGLKLPFWDEKIINQF